ncbi:MULTISPECIES: protein-L-isoaspartate(D-aspartate) O-methyltransferase [unclassified Campylobacter]|uniref:protein-L-isoaspartate(D-aspartate) O-methyltransferase n=1 Tax=unclassified Campylobacter TaxID=2593542 RepID=UPI0022E9F21D|nr:MULTISPECIES: protein-L-isoaspartate(D-aspartate) O-methyltransferase [unclassified Campylobacter]MDA3062649.1 protein-L-isoaspartate(D-aspartate) O-methyltransferase [Campylobacter sp. JMF_14 EL1]MDA3073905.1 protein-L-isoaspartate(D-aspartate) O-methyltransferase [Campylobacter sp. JMF_10 EL2]
MQTLEKLRCEKMAEEIADKIAISPALYDALKSVSRSEFAPFSAHAFSLNAQPILASQWISSPLTVARMSMALDIDESVENVLEIGCGSGYQSAILAYMVRRVFAVERVERLVGEAKKHFANLGIRNINLRHDDGNVGWREFAPYDRILLSACASKISDRLFAQLKIGGILVAPMSEGGAQYIIKFHKISPSEISQENLGACEFVPLISGIQ